MSRQIVWQYGTSVFGGSGDNQLNNPLSAVELLNGNVLISEYLNNRVIEVARNRQIVWQYGTSGSGGSGDNQLNNPYSAVELLNGNVLIADYLNHRVIEVSR